MRSDRLARRSIDEEVDPSLEDLGIKKQHNLQEWLENSCFLEHRKNFENHRKQHYNEFEIVRLRKKEIEDELRALEQEEQKETNTSASNESNRAGTGNET